MSLYYSDEHVTLHHGDCLDVLAELPDASVDSVVTDPPYDLTANKRGGTGMASVNLNSPAGRARITAGFMGQGWDGTGIAFKPDVWVECLRVLKPGGHLLAFGGSRTWHRWPSPSRMPDSKCATVSRGCTGQGFRNPSTWARRSTRRRALSGPSEVA